MVIIRVDSEFFGEHLAECYQETACLSAVFRGLHVPIAISDSVTLRQ